MTAWLCSMLVLLFGARTIVRNRQTGTNLRYWTAAMRECPGSTRARIGLAEQLQRMGETERAVSLYRSVLDVDHPMAGTAAANLAQCLISLKRDEEAAQVLNAGIERWPDHVGLLVSRGVFLMRFGLWGPALMELEHALRAQPDSPEALEFREECRRKIREGPESEKQQR